MSGMPTFGIPVFDQPEIFGQFIVGYVSAVSMHTGRAVGIYILCMVASAILLFPIMILFIFGFIGAVLGLSVNLLSSLFVNRTSNPWLFALIGMFGFVIPPLAFAGPDKTIAWLSRPSLSKCRASRFPIEMGSLQIEFSGDPAFYIQDFRKPLNGDAHSISSREDADTSQFKYFCAEALAAKSPLRNIALEVRPEWMSESWVQDHCSIGIDKLRSSLCHLARQRSASDYKDYVGGIVFYPETLADRYFGFMYDPDGRLKYEGEGSYTCTNSKNEYLSVRNFCLAGGTVSEGVRYRIKFTTSSSDVGAAALQARKQAYDLLNAMTVAGKK